MNNERQLELMKEISELLDEQNKSEEQYMLLHPEAVKFVHSIMESNRKRAFKKWLRSKKKFRNIGNFKRK